MAAVVIPMMWLVQDVRVQVASYIIVRWFNTRAMCFYILL